MQPCFEDSRSLFEKLQQAEGLDLRDNRGKRHDLAVVLVGVVLALLSKRDGCLSSIHRHVVKRYARLVAELGVEYRRPISRAQLPRLLGQVAVAVLDELLLAHGASALVEEEKKWFALDGKELKGSRSAGATRGEAVVRAIAHEGQRCQGQAYYDGQRESELATTQQLLQESALAGQKLSFDALHCQVKTLEAIVQAKGKYLVGVKGNQPELRRHLERVSGRTSCLYACQEVEKGHGRLETRSYEFYDLLGVATAEKWHGSQLRTCVKVTRTSEALKTQKSRREDSYYVTNEVGNYEELSLAIRHHWQVETDNYVRDVSLQEDALRSQSKGLQRVLAGARTVVLEVLKQIPCVNKNAQLEHFADDFEDLLRTLRALNFL